MGKSDVNKLMEAKALKLNGFREVKIWKQMIEKRR